MPVSFINTVNFPASGNLHIRSGQKKLTSHRIKRKLIDARPARIHENGTGAIQQISGGHLLAPRLQKIALAVQAMDGKNRPERCVDVDIRGSVQGIEKYGIFPRPFDRGSFSLAYGKRLVHFFGNHDLHNRAILKSLDKKLVGVGIHALHLFAMDVSLAGRAEAIRETSYAQVPGNFFPARNNSIHDRG